MSCVKSIKKKVVYFPKGKEVKGYYKRSKDVGVVVSEIVGIKMSVR